MRPHRLIAVALFLALVAGLSRTVGSTQAAVPTLRLVAPPTAVAPAAFDVQVVVSDTANLGAFEFDLVYDRSRLQVITFTLTTLLGQGAGCNPASTRCAVRLGPTEQSSGAMSLGAYTYGTGSGPGGLGTLGTVVLQPLLSQAAVTTTLQLANALLADTAGNSATPAVQGTTITLLPAQRLYLPLIRR